MYDFLFPRQKMRSTDSDSMLILERTICMRGPGTWSADSGDMNAASDSLHGSWVSADTFPASVWNLLKSIVTLRKMLTTSRVLAWLVCYHSLVSQFSRFLIGLFGYRGSTRAQLPDVHHPIRLSFTSCYPVPMKIKNKYKANVLPIMT